MLRFETSPFAAILTPHNAVPRWPVESWVNNLVEAMAVGVAARNLRTISLCLNNAALIAVHLGKPDLAGRLCERQIEILARGRGRWFEPTEADVAILQPALNMLRLRFRRDPHRLGEELEMFPHLAAGSSGMRRRAEGRIRDLMRTDPRLTDWIDDTVTREIAQARAHGILAPNEPKASGLAIKVGTTPAAHSMLAEAAIRLGMTSTDTMAALDASVFAAYYLSEAAGLSRADVECIGEHLESRCAMPGLNRSHVEIACELLRLLAAMGWPGYARCALALETQLVELNDEVLLRAFYRAFTGDGFDAKREAVEARSLYGRNGNHHELRETLAMRLQGLCADMRAAW